MEGSPPKVTWSRKAEDQLLEVFEFWEATAGFEKADAVADALVSKTRLLTRHPEMGSIDQKMSNPVITIRYLLEGIYKIYYTYDREEHLVMIRRIWDTRRDSGKIN
jgi:plasmid stabilization system protein ParE